MQRKKRMDAHPPIASDADITVQLPQSTLPLLKAFLAQHGHTNDLIVQKTSSTPPNQLPNKDRKYQTPLFHETTSTNKYNTGNGHATADTAADARHKQPDHGFIIHTDMDGYTRAMLFARGPNGTRVPIKGIVHDRADGTMRTKYMNADPSIQPILDSAFNSNQAEAFHRSHPYIHRPVFYHSIDMLPPNIQSHISMSKNREHVLENATEVHVFVEPNRMRNPSSLDYIWQQERARHGDKAIKLGYDVHDPRHIIHDGGIAEHIDVHGNRRVVKDTRGLYIAGADKTTPQTIRV